jgi:hypothetical protein
MNAHEFVKAVATCKNPMFGHRDSLPDALTYAQDLIEGINKKDKAFAYTALYVVWNTFSKLAEECKECDCKRDKSLEVMQDGY